MTVEEFYDKYKHLPFREAILNFETEVPAASNARIFVDDGKLYYAWYCEDLRAVEQLVALYGLTMNTAFDSWWLTR